ncbi:hypothetical protein VKT23_007656 [Stygiomarasmius scandens]|uniref:BHLH domain-containing protein n=1 Tax=Marasmiellus scandens TaxID=2682957 RepID=A0ABR1JMK0_9AGAR
MDTATEGAEARSSSPMDRNQDATKNDGSSPSGSSGSSNADTKKGNDSADAIQPPSSETGTQDVPSFGLSPFLSQLGLGSGAGNASSLSQFPQFNLDFLNMNAANMGASGEGVSQQLLLEQVKLAQLQQLQQLQSQIFQQQMAIINGTSNQNSSASTPQAIPAMSGIQNTNKSTSSGQHGFSSNSAQQQSSRTGQYGLPTPGSSTELRASASHPVPIEFVSPMILNYADIEQAGVESIDIDDMGSMSGPSRPRNSSTSRNYPSSYQQTQNNHPMSTTHTPVFGANAGNGMDSDTDMDQLPPLTPLSASGHQSHQQHLQQSNTFSGHAKQNSKIQSRSSYSSHSFNPPQNHPSGSHHSSPYHSAQYANSSNLHLNTDFPPSPSLTSSYSPNTSASGRGHDYYLSHRGTSSAPAHIAFGNPLTGFSSSSNPNPFSHQGSTPMTPLPPELEFDISPLTSPWLGADMGNGAGAPAGRVQSYHRHHSQQQQQNQFSQQSFGQKRSASPSMTDNPGSVDSSRKRQMSVSQSPLMTGGSSSAMKKPGLKKGSRSTTSTPLMNPSTGRGTDSAMHSPNAVMDANSMFSGMFGAPGSGHLSAVSSSGHLGSSRTVGGNNNNGNVVGDSPSPVDLSMPPPVAPKSSSAGNTTTNTPQLGPQMGPPLMPVTPASLMSMRAGGASGLGATSSSLAMSSAAPGLGGSPAVSLNTDVTPSHSSLDSSNASSSKTGSTGNTKGKTGKTAGKQKEKDTLSSVAPRRSTRKSASSGAASVSGVSNGLKAILPASPIFPSHTQSSSSSMQPYPSSSSNQPPASAVPLQVRKTSHKAAEQKRRDSLKTTFDDLRGLLPPIPLPTDSNNNPTQDDGSGVGFLAVAKASLLPGALPPRGPPKSGADGPNKGVSKLQLLVCGNEYIRVLKDRVDRRDDEIAKLRREVAKLRQRVGGDSPGVGDGGMDDFGGFQLEGGMEEECDLERDIDAVEMMNYQQRIAAQADSMSADVVLEEDEGE